MSTRCAVDLAEAARRGRQPWLPQTGEGESLAPGPRDPFTCLEEVYLFSDLSAAEMEGMQLMMPLRRFAAGELLFSQAQPVTALFILKEGRVRIFHVTEEGKALTIAILEPGAVFGEMSLVGQQMYDNYAEAIEESVICQLGVQDVEEYLLSDPRIAVKIAKYLGEQVQRLEERLVDQATRPLAARAAKTVLALADAAPAPRFGQAVSVRLTHEQLAGVLGVTREATSRIMAEFAADGLIRQSRGKISVLDAEALRTVARKTC